MTNETEEREALLPCPFCGGIARYEEPLLENVVKCSGCDVHMLSQNGPDCKPMRINAIRQWNTRAALPTDREARLVEALNWIEVTAAAEQHYNNKYDALRKIETCVRKTLASLPESPKREVSGDMEREAFELKMWDVPIYTFEQAHDGRYHNQYTQNAWHGWQARGALQPKQKEMGGEDVELQLGSLAEDILKMLSDHVYNCQTPLRTKLCLLIRPYIAALTPKAGEVE